MLLAKKYLYFFTGSTKNRCFLMNFTYNHTTNAQWSRTEKYMEIMFSAKPIGFGALVSSEELLGMERGFFWLDLLLGWFFNRVVF